jgi:flavodoxin I
MNILEGGSKMPSLLIVDADHLGNILDKLSDFGFDEVHHISGRKCQMVKRGIPENIDFIQDYEGILLGAYTWGDGDLPDEFLDFYDNMDDLDLYGKKAAVFGSCDSSYPAYGAAVDTLNDKLKALGAEVVLEGLKIELTPSTDEKEVCKNFGEQMAKHFVSIG